MLLAAHGKEGLAIAANEHPQIILCDVRMPQMDGLELRRRFSPPASSIKTTPNLVQGMVRCNDGGSVLTRAGDDPLRRTGVPARDRRIPVVHAH